MGKVSFFETLKRDSLPVKSAVPPVRHTSDPRLNIEQQINQADKKQLKQDNTKPEWSTECNDRKEQHARYTYTGCLWAVSVVSTDGQRILVTPATLAIQSK